MQKFRLWTFCLAFLALSTGFGISYNLTARAREIDRHNHCTGSLTALNEYTAAIRDTAAQLPEENRHEYIRIISEAVGGAKNALSRIPFSLETQQNLQQFFSDTGSFLSTLAGNTAYPNGEQREIIRRVREYAHQLGLALSVILMEEDQSEILNEAALYQAPLPPEIPREEEVFSPVPRLLTEAEAKAIARRYLGSNQFLTSIAGQKDAYRILAGSTFADIRRSDGALLRLSSGKPCTSILLNRAEAKQYADAFLTREGFSSMSIAYDFVRAGRYHAAYQTAGGKLITVGVSLDRGRIVYYDASDHYRTN